MLYKDQYTFLIISRSFLLRMRNVSDKRCRENQSTHFVFSKSARPENLGVCEIMWKNIPQTTIWHMRIACWITKATHTHSEYVTLTAFPLKQRLQELVPLLRFTYTACLVICITRSLHQTISSRTAHSKGT